MIFPLKFSGPAALAVAAVVAAGCGGSSSSGGGSSGSSAANSNASNGSAYGPSSSGSSGQSSTSGSLTTVSSKRVTITTAHSKKLGTYLVDGRRMAIYMFEKDHRGSGKSTCSGSCAAAWPPVIASGKPRVAGGVKASKLTTLRRSDGSRQLVYNGWPLYFFAPDHPGTTTGQGVNGFGAKWYVLAPSGAKIDRG